MKRKKKKEQKKKKVSTLSIAAFVQGRDNKQPTCGLRNYISVDTRIFSTFSFDRSKHWNTKHFLLTYPSTEYIFF